MTVVGLHPEQLIDKLEAGLLRGAERARLDAHLVDCPTCRAELAARSDFAAEVPLSFPERPELKFEFEQSVAPPRHRPGIATARRDRRRALFVGAVTLSASCAFAMLCSRQLPSRLNSWQAASVLRSSSASGAVPKIASTAPASTPPAGTAASSGPVSCPAASSTAPPSAAQFSPLFAPRSSLARASVPAGASSAVTSAAADAAHGARLDSLSLAATAPPAAPGSTSAAARLFAEASRARRDRNAGRAVTLYRQLERDFPNSPESQLSTELLARMLFERGDAAQAATAYDRYLRAGTPVLSAEALVGRARAFERIGKVDAAAGAWREVQQRFPTSIHAELAAIRLAALGAR